MTGQLALVAKVFGRSHQAATEERRPLTIHCHSCRQRLLAAYQPACKGKAINRFIAAWPGKKRQCSRLHALGGLEKLAAVMDKGRARVFRWPLAHYQCRRQHWNLLAKILDRFSCAGKMRSFQIELLA